MSFAIYSLRAKGTVAKTFIWPDLKDSKLSLLNSLDFNVWTFSSEDLLLFTYEIFEVRLFGLLDFVVVQITCSSLLI